MSGYTRTDAGPASKYAAVTPNNSLDIPGINIKAGTRGIAFKTAGEKPHPGSLFMFAGIDEARFKRQVMPGDQLHLHVEIERWMRNVLKLKAEARVDGELAAEARLICAKKDV